MTATHRSIKYAYRMSEDGHDLELELHYKGYNGGEYSDSEMRRMQLGGRYGVTLAKAEAQIIRDASAWADGCRELDSTFTCWDEFGNNF